MSYEYSHNLGTTYTKLRRMRRGGSQTYAGIALGWVAVHAGTFDWGIDGVVTLTEIQTNQMGNASDLASAVDETEFGYVYVGTPVEGQHNVVALEPEGSGSSGSTTVIQGGSVDGAVSGTPIGPDLRITYRSLFEYALTIENYSGPSISGDTVELRLITQDDLAAGLDTAVVVGSVDATMDDTSLVLTIAVEADDSEELETSPPNESLHYVYTCVLVTAEYAVVSGAATIVRAAV